MTGGRRPGRPVRPAWAARAGLLVAVVGLTPLLAACSGDDAGPAAAAPTPSEALWNPCDGLDAQVIGRRFATTYDVDAGTAQQPTCRLAPADDGAPALEANYLLFDASLDDVLKTFGEADDATSLTHPDVAGADDAALVALVRQKTLLVTGFVQNDDLIQTVNVVAPAPFDRSQVVRATRDVLADFSAHAEEAGIDAGGASTIPDPQQSPSADPTP